MLILANLPDVSANWGLSGVRLAWAVGQDFENKKGAFPPLVGQLLDICGTSLCQYRLGAFGCQHDLSQEGWAVGQDNQNKKGVLLHFFNNSWTSVDPPSVSTDWGLSSVVLISSNEGWAARTDNENKKRGLAPFFRRLMGARGPSRCQLRLGAFGR